MAPIQTVLAEAIGWLASEHKFFVELKQDLAKLKKDLDDAKKEAQVKDIKLCFKDFRYLGVSEARFNQREQHIEQALKELLDRKITITGSIKEIQELLQRLRTEAANLIRSSSLYEGKIRDFLIHLQKEIKDSEMEQAHALLMELGTLIEQAEQWIAALSVDLERAKRLLQELEEEKDPHLEDLSKKETRVALEAMLKGYGWRDVRSSFRQDGTDYYVVGIVRGETLNITLFPKTKMIQLRFSAPPDTRWPQKSFKIMYDILKQRARGQNFRNFLSILLPELYRASISAYLGGSGDGSNLPRIINQALGS